MLEKEEKGLLKQKSSDKAILKKVVLLNRKSVGKQQLRKKVSNEKSVDTEYFLSDFMAPEKKALLRVKVHYLIGKFVNHLMVSGKKESAEKLLKEALWHLYTKEKSYGLIIFLKALEFTRPAIDLRSVRRGGATYQIPVPLKEKRSLSMSIKWLIEAGRKKGNDSPLNLCNVLIEASKKQGDAVKKRELLHLTALKNRSLTHFRWF